MWWLLFIITQYSSSVQKACLVDVYGNLELPELGPIDKIQTTKELLCGLIYLPLFDVSEAYFMSTQRSA